MSKKMIDIVGQKFNKWLVVEFHCYVPMTGVTFWLCQCECGTVRSVRQGALKIGSSKSCGCSRRGLRAVNGFSGHRLYRIWMGILKRCNHINNVSYHYYGGRGIEVCNKWLVFDNFIKWGLENGYDDKLTLDRIDNNGNYEPSNCRWADRKTQSRNKRNNRLLTFNGKTQCVFAWAEELNIKHSTIFNRLERGWTPEKALTQLIEKRIPKVYTFNGRTQTLWKWAKTYNIKYSMLHSRINELNWTIEEALTTLPQNRLLKI
jgi:hypothetical protein